MKKILLVTTLLASISSASALAKTEGNYVGLDLLRSNTEVKSNSDNKFDQQLNSLYYSSKDKDSSFGVGINYKHAFNMNNFFVAPGVFFEQLGLESKTGYEDAFGNGYNQTVNLNSRYGAKVDFGYDITDSFSAYVPVGLSVVNYEIKTYDYDNSGSYIQTKKSGRESGLFYGLGFSYALTKDIGVNLEYNRLAKLNLTSVNKATFNRGTIKADVNVDVVKIGASYHF